MLLQLKHYRDGYLYSHWRAITSGRVKTPASYCFHGRLIQVWVPCRALHLDVFHSPLFRNTHLQKRRAFNPPSSGRLWIVRFDLIAPYGVG